MKIFIIFLIGTMFTTHFTEAYYSEIDGMKYFVSCPMKRNWHMAFKFCLENGMHLIDIPTVQEEVRLLSLVLRSGKIIIFFSSLRFQL